MQIILTFIAWAMAFTMSLSANVFGGPLPDDFPEVEVFHLGEPTPGRIYFEAYPVGFLQRRAPLDPDNWHYLIELDSGTGEVVSAKRMPIFGMFFQRLNEDQLSYYRLPLRKLYRTPNFRDLGALGLAWGDFVITDNRFQAQRVIPSGPGIIGIDGHELLPLDNGNLIYFDNVIETRDYADANCTVACIVVGQIVREIDPQGNTVIEHNLLDYYGNDYLPVYSVAFPGTDERLADLTHANSADVTDDGGWIISVREYDEVIKIDRETGELIWRLSGVGNEFTFIDDPRGGFSRQHTARVLDNGNLLIFDNGVMHDPPVSRVIEYELDEDAKTATLVWSYTSPTNQFAPVTGSAQRMPNGNTLINWGPTQPRIAEVNPDGEVVMVIYLPEHLSSYRAQYVP